MKLEYKDWMAFQTAQRLHYNFLENIMQLTTCIALAGLYFPITAAIWGGVVTLGRLIYQFGYRLSPKTRFFGAPFILLTAFGLPIFTIVSLALFASSGADV